MLAKCGSPVVLVRPFACPAGRIALGGARLPAGGLRLLTGGLRLLAAAAWTGAWLRPALPASGRLARA